MKYYNFFIDDNLMFLEDLSKDPMPRLFSHFYLKGLKELHEKYGTLFTLNLFYTNQDESFSLADFPDTYYDQWKEASSWLKLAFHSYSESPEKPYKEGNHRYNKLPSDYQKINTVIP